MVYPCFSTYSVAIKYLKASKNTHISSQLQEEICKNTAIL